MARSLVEKAARSLMTARGLGPDDGQRPGAWSQVSGQRTALVSAAPGWQAATHQGAPVTPEGFWRNGNALGCGQLSRCTGG
jgi:hypothetical protein